MVFRNIEFTPWKFYDKNNLEKDSTEEYEQQIGWKIRGENNIEKRTDQLLLIFAFSFSIEFENVNNI